MDPLLTKLRAEEARKKDLIQELEQLAGVDQITSIDQARLKRELKVRFADITALLDRHDSSARQLLRVVMENPLRCEAVQEGDRKEYRVIGAAQFPTEKLLRCKWCPQRELKLDGCQPLFRASFPRHSKKL